MKKTIVAEKEDYAVWSMFLWNGFMDACGRGLTAATPEQKALYDKHSYHAGIGMDGVARNVAEVAIHLADRFAEVWSARVWDADYPGVFEYEILEPLGTWLTGQEVYNNGYALEPVAMKFDELFAEWLVTHQLTGT